jgi:hypothetical protein
LSFPNFDPHEPKSPACICIGDIRPAFSVPQFDEKPTSFRQYGVQATSQPRRTSILVGGGHFLVIDLNPILIKLQHLQFY